MSADPPTLFTIGYSAHTLAAFVGLLKMHGVSLLADVRSQPYSRLEDFRKDHLEQSLPTEGVRYVFLGRQLGARRDEPECYVNGQADYGRIAQLPAFLDGIDQLHRLMAEHVVAIMCAEKEPLDCHRTILVARHLQADGVRVRHILADGAIEEHTDTERRLVRMLDIQPNLFEPDNSARSLIDRAYTLRSRDIAYRPEAIAPPDALHSHTSRGRFRQGSAGC